MSLYKKTLPVTLLNTAHVKKKTHILFPAYRKDTGRTPEGYRKKTGLALKFALSLWYVRVNMIHVMVAGRPSVKQVLRGNRVRLNTALVHVQLRES